MVLSHLLCGPVLPQPQETPAAPPPGPTGAGNGDKGLGASSRPSPRAPRAELPTAQPVLGTESVFHKQSFEPNFIFLTQGKSLEENMQTLGLQRVGVEGCFVAS